MERSFSYYAKQSCGRPRDGHKETPLMEETVILSDSSLIDFLPPEKTVQESPIVRRNGSRQDLTVKPKSPTFNAEVNHAGRERNEIPIKVSGNEEGQKAGATVPHSTPTTERAPAMMHVLSPVRPLGDNSAKKKLDMDESGIGCLPQVQDWKKLCLEKLRKVLVDISDIVGIVESHAPH